MYPEKTQFSYEHNPVIRAFMQLIPAGVGSALDSMISTTIARNREARSIVFFQTLAETLTITEEMKANEDFVHKFVITARAALNTSNNDKIKAFARLLANGSKVDKPLLPEIFEEYAAILEGLNFREILLLTMLENFEDKFPKTPGKNQAERVNQYWPEFMKKAKAELQASDDIIFALLSRCNRHGLFDLFQGRFIDSTPGKGELTELYHELRKYIGDKAAYA